MADYERYRLRDIIMMRMGEAKLMTYEHAEWVKFADWIIDNWRPAPCSMKLQLTPEFGGGLSYCKLRNWHEGNCDFGEKEPTR